MYLYNINVIIVYVSPLFRLMIALIDNRFGSRVVSFEHRWNEDEHIVIEKTQQAGACNESISQDPPVPHPSEPVGPHPLLLFLHVTI
jgi:hypothetical protein